MTVFGQKHHEQSGAILLTGTLDECGRFVATLDEREYYELSICDDSGKIIVHVVDCMRERGKA